jgi:hypothetical protein
MQQWAGQGLRIRWLTLLLDDQNEGPPTTNGAKVWKDNWGLLSSAVAADPGFQLVPGSSVGTPQLTLIDPRTMVVVDLQEGYSGNYSLLTQLATQNKP